MCSPRLLGSKDSFALSAQGRVVLCSVLSAQCSDPAGTKDMPEKLAVLQATSMGSGSLQGPGYSAPHVLLGTGAWSYAGQRELAQLSLLAEPPHCDRVQVPSLMGHTLQGGEGRKARRRAWCRDQQHQLGGQSISAQDTRASAWAGTGRTAAVGEDAQAPETAGWSLC